ncbi:MAG: chorismate-binding protein [Patescibacteria group bacterium]
MNDFLLFRHEVEKARREGRRWTPVVRKIYAPADPLDAYRTLLIESTRPACILQSAVKDGINMYSFVCWDAPDAPVILGANTHADLALNTPAPHELLPFVGGLVGYIGHEAVRHIEPTVVPHAHNPYRLPETCFYHFGKVVVFDHATGIAYGVANAPTSLAESSAYEVGCRAIAEMERMILSSHAKIPADRVMGNITSNMTRDQYYTMVKRAKESIASGDVFQVVLSQRFSMPFCGLGVGLYAALRTLNPSPYMFHMRLGSACRSAVLVGASPEIMVSVKDSQMRIKPIAGTRRRTGDIEEDARLAQELLTDPKERAEHQMLVDLGRNDIGRQCRADSITISTLMEVEYYSHVMHIVSDIRGRLRDGVNPLDACLGALPAGTLSGAPKVRALQLISELEASQRGPYGGAFGWMTDHTLDTCIFIRSALLLDNTLSWQTGGGIVADSTPEGEYEETLAKANAIRAALKEL